MQRANRSRLQGVKGRLKPWKTLKTKELFVASPWIKLSVHQVRLPNGRLVDDYYQIKLPDYVVVFAQTTGQKVVVERQYKHGVGRCTLVLPAGVIEEGEDPLLAAQRELLEEAGYTSADWHLLGSFVGHGSYGCGEAHLFVAHNAQKVAEPNSGDLEEIEILLMKLEDIVNAVRTGEVALLGSAAAIALATSPVSR